jgi:hypothetical protein
MGVPALDAVKQAGYRPSIVVRASDIRLALACAACEGERGARSAGRQRGPIPRFPWCRRADPRGGQALARRLMGSAHARTRAMPPQLPLAHRRIQTDSPKGKPGLPAARRTPRPSSGVSIAAPHHPDRIPASPSTRPARARGGISPARRRHCRFGRRLSGNPRGGVRPRAVSPASVRGATEPPASASGRDGGEAVAVELQEVVGRRDEPPFGASSRRQRAAPSGPP